MKPKPITLLLTAALVAMAIATVLLVFDKDTASADPAGGQPGSHRERQTERREAFRSKIKKPVRELSGDDLLAICDREGAAAALAAAKSHPWPYRDARVYFILTHLAAKDPAFAAAELKTSGLTIFLKTGLIDSILKNWTDDRKALDWAESQLTGELRGKAVAGALGILVKSEPEAAFGYFETMPDCKARSQAMRELFTSWGSHDPETALSRVGILIQGDVRSPTEHILRGWAAVDPEAAAAWVLKAAPHDGEWIAGVIQSWSSVSPDQARLWFDALPEGDAKKTAYGLTYLSSGTFSFEVISPPLVMQDNSWSMKAVSERNDTDLLHWTEQDTEGARSFVERNGADPISGRLASQVAVAISNLSGPSEAIDWAQRLPEQNRKISLDAILTDWAYRDPAAAAGKLEEILPALGGKAPIWLVNDWAKQDPAAAADWVEGWRGGERAAMVGCVIAAWTNHNPNAACQWLGNLPAGPDRDNGIVQLVQKEEQAGATTDTLMPWIDQISDPKLRTKALGNRKGR